jgi:N-acetylglutamate synthase-like GNAT family acetyltransferase
MPKLKQIMSKEIPLEELLSNPLKKLLATSAFEFQIVNDEDSEMLEEMDLLIEEIFPATEALEYQPRQILSSEPNSLCIASIKNGIVYGCITATFNLENNTVELISLAVDQQFRNQKIGTILMLLLQELSCKLQVTSLSLISSSYGMAFYKSFGFTEMAHNSFESCIPFPKNIIRKKIADQTLPTPEIKDLKKNKRRFYPDSLFSSTEVGDRQNQNKRQKLSTSERPAA